MKNFIVSLMLVWFFGLQYESPMTEGARVKVLIGPFTTKLECEKEQSAAKEFFDMYLGEGQVETCTEKVKL